LPLAGPVGMRSQALMSAAVRCMSNTVADSDRDVVARAWRAAGSVARRLDRQPLFDHGAGGGPQRPMPEGGTAQAARRARWIAAMPPVRLVTLPRSQPLASTSSRRACWSGQSRMDSARYTEASGFEDTLVAILGSARMR